MSDGAVCSVHGKKRTMANLTSDGAGGQCCAPGMECKDAGGGGGGGGVKSGAGAPANMKEGDWNCPGCGDHQFARNAQCRKCGTPKPNFGGGGGGPPVNQEAMTEMMFAKGMATALGMGQASMDIMVSGWGETMGMFGAGGGQMFGGTGTGNAKVGGGGKGGGGGGGGGDAVCSVHGKKRGVKNLQDDGAGGMCCAPGNECQMGGGGGQVAAFNGGGPQESAVCSVHGKKRGSSNMIADGAGGMCCAPGMECKGGAGGGGAPGGMGAAPGGGARPGDWVCEGCGDNQFGRNMQCRKCGTPKPGTGPGGPRFSPY